LERELSPFEHKKNRFLQNSDAFSKKPHSWADFFGSFCCSFFEKVCYNGIRGVKPNDAPAERMRGAIFAT
jgi:hypothetical protein